MLFCYHPNLGECHKLYDIANQITIMKLWISSKCNSYSNAGAKVLLKFSSELIVYRG